MFELPLDYILNQKLKVFFSIVNESFENLQSTDILIFREKSL